MQRSHPHTREDHFNSINSTDTFLLPFNTVVTRRYALCIKYNQYARPQKCVTKVATNYMAIYLFQELQISIQRKSKGHNEAEKLCTFNVNGQYTQTTISLPLSAI